MGTAAAHIASFSAPIHQVAGSVFMVIAAYSVTVSQAPVPQPAPTPVHPLWRSNTSSWVFSLYTDSPFAWSPKTCSKDAPGTKGEAMLGWLRTNGGAVGKVPLSQPCVIIGLPLLNELCHV